jgi:hypothetical protein
MSMGGLDPASNCSHQGAGAGQFLQPPTRFVEGAHDPFRVGVALGVVITGEGLMNPPPRAGLYAHHRRGLTPVVRHQRQTRPTRPRRALPVDRHVQCGLSMRSDTGGAGIIPPALIRLPVPDQDDVHLPNALDQHCCHIDPPPIVGLGQWGVWQVRVRLP